MARPKKKVATSTVKKPQLLPGLADIVPLNGNSWDYINQKLQQTARAFGYTRIEVPFLENASLYDSLDTEEKTVITFTDPEGRKVAVRPEALPGVMRAFADVKIEEGQKLFKWYYIAPSTSYDEKQKKYASEWEYGFELFSEVTPLTEAQMTTLILKFLRAIGLENISIEVNSVGRKECRVHYEDTLKSFLQSKKYELCNNCVSNLEEYPMQVFRCKNLECQTVAAEAPPIVDFLDDDCHKHFAHILEALDELGIPYALNPMLVGKEGTSKTVISVKYKDEMNEYFVGEAAYHDEIYTALTGKQMACFGFTGNLAVLQRILQSRDLSQHAENKAEVFLVPLGDLASKKALKLFSELWDENISVHDHFGDSGVKNQLKMAEASKAVIALIIGQKEAMDEMVILRDVKSGMQEVFQYDRIIEEVKKRLGKV